MERVRLSVEGDSLEDSRGELELERLRTAIKEKNRFIDEKCKIITSLRFQVEDFQREIEELEKGDQLMRQKLDRVGKEQNDKDETIEAISHALKEVEAANEALTKRLNSRMSQVQKLVEDLDKAKKELEEVKALNHQNEHQRELLQIELDSTKRVLREKERDTGYGNEALLQELEDLRAKVRSLCKLHVQKPSVVGVDIDALKRELEETDTSWKLEKLHKERYARENIQLERKVHQLTRDLNDLNRKFTELENRSKYQQPPPLPPKNVPVIVEQQENKSEMTSAFHFSMADEVGEFMDRSSSIPSYRIKKSSFALVDPVAEEKLRLERVNELARRNMQTKPLHQTSYPLELDTFDVPNLTENQIKRGYVPPLQRQALNDSSNYQRRPVKKAEAFII